MKLYIDTSSNQQTIIKLDSVVCVEPSSVWHSQVVLPMIVNLLKKNNRKLTELSEIEVNIGPGSYTGLRVGVVIANTLGFCLKIPVNGKLITSSNFLEPVYVN